MEEHNHGSMVPDEIIMEKIYLIRGEKVMLDSDLAKLYGVETKQLKRAVRRNMKRFPVEFMFELTKGEYDKLKVQFGALKRGGHSKYLPFAFTEEGVSMLSSVLNSDTAIMVNIQIMKIFRRLRRYLLSHKDILLKLEQIERQLAEHDNKILVIFEYLKQLETAKQEEIQYKDRPRIGFKRSKE